MPKAKFLTHKDHKSGNYCLISYADFKEEDYNNNNVVKLKCGHNYIYQHIIESYKITNCSGRNYIGKRICPYCRKSGGYLPYNGSPAIRGVHNLNAVKAWRLKTIENKKKNSGYKTCCATLVCGIHRGNPCGSLVKTEKNPNIFKCVLSNEDTLVNAKFESLNWCGKHKKKKEQFQNINIDIENFIENFNENFSIKSEYLKITDFTINEKIYKLYLPFIHYTKIQGNDNKLDLNIRNSLIEKFKDLCKPKNE